MKEGRYVGLDFYDLLIEAILVNNAVERPFPTCLTTAQNPNASSREPRVQ